MTALSDAANEFDGAPAEFPTAFREGELERDDWLPVGACPPDAVALLTVHQAKGLEWDAVFVCDLVEGRFPALARSQYALFDRDGFRRRAARRGRARPPRARGGAAPLLRRADAGAHAALPDRDGGGARGVRPLAVALLPRGAAVPRARAASATDLVSAAEALAALRRAGGGPPGWRDRVETTNANRDAPDRRPPDVRLAPRAVRELPAAVLLRQPASRSAARARRAMRLGGVFHDVLEAFHDPERNEPQTLERLLELAEEQSFEEVIRPRPLAAEQRRLLEKLLAQLLRVRGRAAASTPRCSRSSSASASSSTRRRSRATSTGSTACRTGTCA